MAQIYIHALVPIFLSHLGKFVAIVTGCIVDQNSNSAQPRFDLRNSRLQGGYVSQIT